MPCELGEALILRHLLPDVLGNGVLQLVVNLPVVEASAVSVEIEVFIDVLDVATRHLQHRQADHLIVGGVEPLPVLILEVLLLDLQIEVDSK